LARAVVKKLGLNFRIKNHISIIDSIATSDNFPLGKYYLKFEGDGFLLISNGGKLIGEGKIGKTFANGFIKFFIRQRPKENIEFTILDLNASAEELLKNISVSQIKNTALVSLGAKSTSPQLAAAVANSLAEEYINYTLYSLKESIRGSKEFIKSQIEAFGAELNNAEENLRRYKEKKGIFLLNESAKEIISSLAHFEAEKERAIVELNEAKSTTKNLEQVLLKDEATYGAYKEMAAFPTLSMSPIVASLKEKLKSLELKRQELIQDKMKVKELQEVEIEIKAVEEKLRDATRQIVLAGPSINDPIFQSIISNIINNETRQIALQSRIDALNQIIIRENQRLKQLPEAEVRLAQLEREKMANEEIYTMLLSKLEESKIAEAMQISEAKIVDYATIPVCPVEPKVRQNTLLGFLLGILIGVGGAFLLEYLDTTIKSSKEIEELTKTSVLATIPFIKESSEIPTIDEPNSQIAESYKILRTNLAFSAASKPLKSLLITSTIPQEGKTTICINLGITLAQQGHKTIILDCDFRRPMLHRYFKRAMKNEHGLSDVLIGKLKLKDSIINAYRENLYCITCGTIPPNPTELLSSSVMRDVLEELKKTYEFIIIDSPPALGVADARILGRICDGILVVIFAKKTNRDAAVEVKEELERAGEKIVGYVLNGVDYTHYHYRHHYYYYHPVSNPDTS